MSEQATETAQKLYAINEQGMQSLMSALLELKAREANPIINFIQQNFKEIQTQPTPTEGGE